MSRTLPDERPSRKAKIYEFLSRSTSRSRSRSKSTTRRSESNESPPDLPGLSHSATTTSTSGTSESHFDEHATPTRARSKPLTRSPSRPFSNTTAGTDTTVTPTNNRSCTPRPAHPPQFKHPAYPVNDSGIGVNEYDARMPPPPVPVPVHAPVPVQAQTPTPKPQKRKSKPATLFGISLPVRSRPPTPTAGLERPVHSPAPPTPKSTNHSAPTSSKSRSQTYPVATPSASGSRRPPMTAMTAPPTPTVAPDPVLRPRSTPPRDRPVSSDSERDGRCSPLFGLGAGARRMFRSRSRGKEKEKDKQKEREVGRPVMVKAGGRHGSFDFERPGELRRSTSQAGARRPSGQSSRTNHPRTDHTRSPPTAPTQHLRGGTLPQTSTQPRTQVPTHTHSQSTSAVRRARAHGSPLVPNSPLVPPSAHSHSTDNAAAAAAGSWGRQARSQGWARAGVLPPFAFESAASGSGSASAGRASPAMSEGRARLARDREREREKVGFDLGGGARERGRAGYRDGVRSGPAGAGGEGREGRWEQKEVDLGLGLTWAPSKIRVREWTAPTGEKERQREREEWEREGERRARERYEMGYAHPEAGGGARSAGRRKTDKEVTGRYRQVLGDPAFDTFKKYVRRFDADIIPLDGLLARVGRLLDAAPTHLNEREKREMLEDLVRIVRENEW
ncbi:hypothetical protein FA95DRAFT_591764 [Auriscalpium vulgare]|uniref:Uncharacterized protein n=1 Tax=Auriscalpium vulgare TaxID=40419 RepID=A0ACB8RF55_9AGAM|nr:hypothetical protein FA95DRAFT_591764 [Auriscalpium vulgare]